MIVRAKKESKFTTVYNEFIYDEKLSARSKGVMLYLLSRPDDWVVNKQDLFKHFKEGREAIWNAFKELVEHGYALYVPIKKQLDGGKWKTEVQYILYEVNINSKNFNYLYPDEPKSKNREPKSRIQTSVSLINTEVTNTDTKYNIVDSDFEEVWSLYPNKTNKEQAKKYYNAKTRINTRPEIRAAVKNYAAKVKKEKTEKQFIMGGRAFFKDERWREYYVEPKKTTDIPDVAGIGNIETSRAMQLWELANEDENTFAVYVMAEQSGTKR